MSTKQKVIIGLGAAALFAISFVLFAYWTFPYDRLRDYLVQEVEAPAGPDGTRRPSGVELTIGSLEPSWLTGVELESVRVSKRAESPEDTPIELFVEEASVRIGLLALIGGSTSIGYDAVLAGGEIEGEYEESAESTRLAAEITDINVRQLGVLRGLVGLPVIGTLNGTVDLTIAETPAQTQGTASLRINNLAIGDGRAKLMLEGLRDGLTVDRLDAGTLELELAVASGTARVTKLRADGPHIELDGSGTIALRRPLGSSRLDLTMRLKIKDAYRQQSDRTRALFSLMDFNPRLRAARTPDGALQYRITGSPSGRISTSPAGRAARPGRAP